MAELGKQKNTIPSLRPTISQHFHEMLLTSCDVQTPRAAFCTYLIQTQNKILCAVARNDIQPILQPLYRFTCILCCSNVLMPASSCRWRLAHLDYREYTKVLLNIVTYTISMPYKVAGIPTYLPEINIKWPDYRMSSSYICSPWTLKTSQI